MAEHMCSWCLESKDVVNPDPEHFCLDCNKYLCNDCADSHLRKHKHNIDLKIAVNFCEVCNIAPVCAFCFDCKADKYLCDMCATKHNSFSETVGHKLEFHDRKITRVGDREEGITIASGITNSDDLAEDAQGNAGASSNDVSQHNFQFAVYSESTPLNLHFKEQNRGSTEKGNVSEKDKNKTQSKYNCVNNPEMPQLSLQDKQDMSDEYVDLKNVLLTISDESDVLAHGLMRDNKNTLHDARKTDVFEKKRHTLPSSFRIIAATISNDKTKIGATRGLATEQNKKKPHFGEEDNKSTANDKKDDAPRESESIQNKTEPCFEDEYYESIEPPQNTAASISFNDKTKGSASKESAASRDKSEHHVQSVDTSEAPGCKTRCEIL